MSRRLLFLALAASSTASAAFVDGNELQRWATSGEQEQWAMALAYVQGVVDGFSEFNAMSETDICPPANVQVGQIYAVTKKYLAANPEQWHLSGGILVTTAIREAWPCTSEKR